MGAQKTESSRGKKSPAGVREYVKRGHSAPEGAAYCRDVMLSVFDSIDEIVYVTDPQTYEVLYMNKFARETLGKNPIGKICYEELQNRDRRCEFCPEFDAERNETCRWEYHNKVLGKTYLVSDRLIRWVDGRSARFELAIDITERKKAEQALRESEQKFRSMFEVSPYSTVLVDLQGNIQECNQQFVKMHATKEPAEAQVGRNISEFFALKERSRLIAAIERTIKEKKTAVRPVEYTMLREDGSEFAGEGFSVVMLGENGSPKAVLGLAHDITERKQAEEAVRKSGEKYRLVSENIPVAVYSALPDEQSTNLFVSGRIEELTGYSGTEFMEDPELYTRILHPDDRGYVRERIEEQRRSKGDLDVEYRIVTRDNKVKWVRDKARPMIDEQGRITRIDGFMEDTTARKQLEQELGKRLKNEAALAACSKILLTEPESGKSVRRALEHLLRASGADRVHIFENFEDPVDGLCMRLSDEICAEGIRSETSDKALQHTPYSRGFERWQRELSAGRAIAGAVSVFPQCEQRILKKRQIVSTLVLPIRVGGYWYGFIGFDDLSSQRQWTEEDVQLLRTTAEIIAAHLESRWAHEVLRESEERFRTVADFTYDFEYWIGPDGKFIYVSPSCERVTGYRAEEFLADATLFERLIVPEDRPAMAKHLTDALSKPEASEVDVRILTKDGQQRWISHVCQPVYGTDGTWLGRRASNRDITARKTAETRLLAYQRQLKSVASELLLVGEKEKMRLAQGLHDRIGQSLALIKLRVQSLMEESLKPKVGGSLQEILDTFNAVIEDIQSLTFELSNPVLYELGLRAAVEHFLTDKIERKYGLKCKLRVSGGASEPDVNVSIVLFQAIRELLVNVVRHARAKTVTVEMSISEQQVEASVTDDGVGFDYDSAVQSCALRESGGFGLFSIREQLEYIGGRMTVCSKRGTGTCVVLTVPLKEQRSVS